MFCVIFEVQPRPELRETYFARGRWLRPELEQIDGFVENIRYCSLTRLGWLLSLSSWRDEKALVSWRTHARHHETQSFGRSRIFLDYHLRVGEVARDTRIPTGQVLRQQRLDETTAGAGTTVSLVSAVRPDDPLFSASGPEATARWLGLKPEAPGLLSWDVFDAVLAQVNCCCCSPGEMRMRPRHTKRTAGQVTAKVGGSGVCGWCATMAWSTDGRPHSTFVKRTRESRVPM